MNLSSFERATNECEAVARAVRILTRLGHFDPTCHVSSRFADGIAITPAFDTEGCPAPSLLTGEDIVLIDGSGRVAGGRLPPAPELSWHQAVYRHRPDVGAMVAATPPHAMAFAAASTPLRPITHAEAWTVGVTSPVLDPEPVLEAPVSLSALISDASVCNIRGVTSLFLGTDVEGAISLCHSYEYLARMNLLARGLSPQVREVSLDEVARIQAERRQPETVGSVDPAAYLNSFDRVPQIRGDRDLDEQAGDWGVMAKVALACRILASQGTLVGFYEHVSHRLQGRPAFAMSPAKSFAQIRTADVGVVALDEEAAWLEGPHAPAPFRRFHRDVFIARPDAQAVVHTHEMYGRAFMGAGIDLKPVSRIGFEFAGSPPTVEQASMVFSAADRADAVAALGDGAMVHTATHGTDYVAATMEEATVAAVHREQAYTMLHRVLGIGTPTPLSDVVVSRLEETAPGAATWWKFYRARLDEPEEADRMKKEET